MTRPVVFLDLELRGEPMGRVKVELFTDAVPRAAENFRQLCTGEYRQDRVPVGYKACRVSSVKAAGFLTCGDFDQRGGYSIYGRVFREEPLIPDYFSPEDFLVTMASPYGSVFRILFTRDIPPGDLVVGRVVEGRGVVRRVESLPVNPNLSPVYPLLVSQCGQMY